MPPLQNSVDPDSDFVIHIYEPWGFVGTKPLPTSLIYPPIPKDVKKVEVSLPWSSKTLQLKVDHGVEKAPKGTKDIPILARNVAYSAEFEENTMPLITTIHAAVHTDMGLLMYYSYAFPEAPKEGEKNELPMYLAMQCDLIDLEIMRDHDGEYAAVTQQGWMEVANKAEKGEAVLAWSLFPGVSKDIESINAVLNNQLFMDIPVSDEMPENTVASATIATLGEAWPNPTDPDGPEYEEVDEEVNRILDSFDTSYVAGTYLRWGIKDGALTEIGTGVDLDAAVLFDVDKADLTPAALDVIDKAVAKIKEAEKAGAKKELLVVGHTDSVADDDHNLDLSKRRAEAVATVLKTALPGWTINTDGKGETEPIASNDTEEGKALNRRVEITWSK